MMGDVVAPWRPEDVRAEPEAIIAAECRFPIIVTGLVRLQTAMLEIASSLRPYEAGWSGSRFRPQDEADTEPYTTRVTPSVSSEILLFDPGAPTSNVRIGSTH